jgi:serine/threonine-protein kinase
MAEVPLPKIGHYQVTGKLGQGGMGVVYKARDAAIGRQVAIKMMTGGYQDPELRERFTREARAAGNLQHANIVTIHELGDQDGTPYIVMEFLDGEPLDHVIAARRPMSLAEKLDIIVQVCQALEYAHQHGVVHRDIKPANVMVLKQGGIKLVDFGIARLGGQKLTRTGTVMGTITYMSPEQINARPVDGRADVFSTGVMLYELASGRLPFEGEDTTQTMIKILSAPVPPIAGLPDCPPELPKILERALAKDREERYPSAAEMAGDLVTIRDRVRAAANAPTVVQGGAAPAPAETVVQGYAAAAAAASAGAGTRNLASAAPAPAETMVQGYAAAVPAAPPQSTPPGSPAAAMAPAAAQTMPAAAAPAPVPAPQKKRTGSIFIVAGLAVVLVIGGFFGYRKFFAGPGATTEPGSAAPAATVEQVSAEEAARRGDAFLNGTGVDKDPAKAAEWYRKAADQGHALAMSRLGTLYQFGLGVPRDPAEAFRLFTRAAEKREPKAILELAHAYRDGSGTEKDNVAAYQWYTIALNFEPVKATADSERELLASSLTAEQMADATQRAQTWLAAHQ